MATSKEQIKKWLGKGHRTGATHMLVVCDTFDWGDYPVYVKQGEDVKAVEKEYDNKNMQKIMEVYNLSKDHETQLNQTRAFNY